MNSKTDNTQNIKAIDRVANARNTATGLSEKDNKALAYMLEKSSRIATATLMLVNVLESDTPLRLEFERTAIRLMRDAANSAQNSTARAVYANDLLMLTALLETATCTGLLSKMNTNTLINEIALLAEFTSTIDWNAGRHFVSDDLYGGDAPRELFAGEPVPTRSETPQGHVKNVPITQNHTTASVAGRYNVGAVKDTPTKGGVQYKERVQEIQKDRRATILGIVQRKDKITVKDVANVIKDCSDKTIQRELLALVSQGVLKKEGERRWSTYSLA